MKNKNDNVESKIARGIQKERYASNHGALAATGIIFLGIAAAVFFNSMYALFTSFLVAAYAYNKIANKI